MKHKGNRSRTPSRLHPSRYTGVGTAKVPDNLLVPTSVTKHHRDSYMDDPVKFLGVRDEARSRTYYVLYCTLTGGCILYCSNSQTEAMFRPRVRIEALEDIGDVTLDNTKARGDPRRPTRVVIGNLESTDSLIQLPFYCLCLMMDERIVNPVRSNNYGLFY